MGPSGRLWHAIGFHLAHAQLRRGWDPGGRTLGGPIPPLAPWHMPLFVGGYSDTDELGETVQDPDRPLDSEGSRIAYCATPPSLTSLVRLRGTIGLGVHVGLGLVGHGSTGARGKVDSASTLCAAAATVARSKGFTPFPGHPSTGPVRAGTGIFHPQAPSASGDT